MFPMFSKKRIYWYVQITYNLKVSTAADSVVAITQELPKERYLWRVGISFLFQKFTDTTTDDLSNAEKAHFIGINFKCLRTPQLMIMLKRPFLLPFPNGIDQCMFWLNWIFIWFKFRNTQIYFVCKFLFLWKPIWTPWIIFKDKNNPPVN